MINVFEELLFVCSDVIVQRNDSFDKNSCDIFFRNLILDSNGIV